MKTKVMETSIISETRSQNTTFREVDEAIKDKIPEIAKKVLRVHSKDKEQTEDQRSIKERENEINQAGQKYIQSKGCLF